MGHEKVFQKNSAQGALVGLAIGDALGCTSEFLVPGQFEPIDEIRGGGVFNVPPGKWTDDTSLALCVADSLICHKSVDHRDIMARFLRWYRQGYRSSTGNLFDIGLTTQKAIELYEQTKIPGPPPYSDDSCGNGSLMRVAPVALHSLHLPIDEAHKTIGDVSSLTHSHPLCIQACQLLGILIRLNCQSNSKGLRVNWDKAIATFKSVLVNPLQEELSMMINTDFATLTPSDLTSGYAIDSLCLALWGMFNFSNFETGMLAIVNLGGDADTNGAIYGQLAGSFYGLRQIPKRWLNKLYLFRELKEIAITLAHLNTYK